MGNNQVKQESFYNMERLVTERVPAYEPSNDIVEFDKTMKFLQQYFVLDGCFDVNSQFQYSLMTYNCHYPDKDIQNTLRQDQKLSKYLMDMEAIAFDPRFQKSNSENTILKEINISKMMRTNQIEEDFSDISDNEQRLPPKNQKPKKALSQQTMESIIIKAPEIKPQLQKWPEPNQQERFSFQQKIPVQANKLPLEQSIQPEIFHPAPIPFQQEQFMGFDSLGYQTNKQLKQQSTCDTRIIEVKPPTKFDRCDSLFDQKNESDKQLNIIDSFSNLKDFKLDQNKQNQSQQSSIQSIQRPKQDNSKFVLKKSFKADIESEQESKTSLVLQKEDEDQKKFISEVKSDIQTLKSKIEKSISPSYQKQSNLPSSASLNSNFDLELNESGLTPRYEQLLKKQSDSDSFQAPWQKQPINIKINLSQFKK
ncbi:hypothetical protein pb186bvf_007295 [Paramecium bursaria]